MAEEYKRSCEDELDWTTVEQLHAATLQISNACYEYKKVCVSFLTASITAFITLTKNSVNHSLFIIIAIIVLGFWLSDSTAYYYQRRLRIIMDRTKAHIANRNGISDYQTGKVTASRREALFNSSMTLYYVLLGISAIGWLSYRLGWVK